MKLFARAVHCLAKIGHEVYVEPLKKGLSLRTVNSSRSAYACFIFMPSFFQGYEDGIPDGDSSQQEALKCKLSVKSFLTVFKSLNTIDRIVHRCCISMSDTEEELTFMLYCLHGIVKTYKLSYQDCESLQAVFAKDLSPNLINVQPQILNEVVTNFHNAAEEISFTVCPQNMTVTNYFDEDEDLTKVIKTKMAIVAEEFDKYQIGVDTEVTFCLKELKAIVTFADTIGLNLDIHFESAGKPIVFSLASDPTFEANFVLATLVDIPVPGSQTSQGKNKQNKRSHKASKHKERQGTKDSQHMDEDEFGLDEEEDWVNDAIAAEERQSQSMQETSTSMQETSRNNRGKHPDFDDSFLFTDVLSKKASTSSKIREASASSKAKGPSTSTQTRKGNTSSETRRAKTSSKTMQTSTSSQVREANTSSQMRNVNTSSCTQRASHSMKHTQIGPHSAPGNLAQEEMPGSMSMDSEISPGTLYLLICKGQGTPSPLQPILQKPDAHSLW